MKIVYIGSGNLATRLSLEMSRVGMDVVQVYSHTSVNAQALAGQLACAWTNKLEDVVNDADLYVFSVKDVALQATISGLPPNRGLWVHTAGSMPLSVFEGYSERYGVIYPLQTFSKNREVKFRAIPFFIEANSTSDEVVLTNLVDSLSDNVRLLSSEKRKEIHLAAVFACNFTNHIYALAAKILEKQDVPMGVLLPLIDETAAKVHEMSPVQAQTGPAVRYDENVINKHLAMLNDSDMRSVYELISRSIYKETHHE